MIIFNNIINSIIYFHIALCILLNKTNTKTLPTSIEIAVSDPLKKAYNYSYSMIRVKFLTVSTYFLSFPHMKMFFEFNKWV